MMMHTFNYRDYEINLLAFDPALTVVVRHRQDRYLGDSHEVLRAEVDAWPIRRRLWNTPSRCSARSSDLPSPGRRA